MGVSNAGDVPREAIGTIANSSGSRMWCWDFSPSTVAHRP